MSILSSKVLKFAKKLIAEGNYEEAFHHLGDLEQEETLSVEEKLEVQEIKGWLYLLLGQMEKALEICEHLFEKSQKLNLPLYSLGALNCEAWIQISNGINKEFIVNIEKCDKIISSIPKEDSLKYLSVEAILFSLKGFREFARGNLDLALDFSRRSVAFHEKIDSFNFNLCLTLETIAYIYQGKGELDLALEYNKKALSSIPKGVYNFQLEISGHIYRGLGTIYYEKGDLDLSLEHYTHAFEIYSKSRDGWWMGWAFFHIISVLLAKKNFTEAQMYLEKFKQYNENHEFRLLSSLYQLSKALILKSSVRMRDRVDAERLFKKIIKKKEEISILNIALINLCDGYFKEFRLSNQIEILNDIYPLIDQLQRYAKRQNSYSRLASVKLLQAKLSLLQINMVDARKLLSEAQKIADEHGLQLLAREISKEHDKLLDELKMWENYKKTQVNISERLKLVSIDSVLDRMQGKRPIEQIESTYEQPVLLLIMSEGGIQVFSYPFTDKWNQDEDLFSSFLSAFTSFSDEFFSKGLDRAKFGEDTILMQSVNAFSVCYLFKGQTYLAKQRLNKFIEAIQYNNSVWETFEKFYNLGQIVELIDIPIMKTILEEVFPH